MSGDWIKVECALPDKPEVWQMAGMLGIDADSVVGKLLRVWSWFDTHTVDGNAVGVTYPLLDRIAGVSGFAEAMALAGWLTQDGSVLSVPNFDRHNGKTAKKRALTNKRVAEHREMQREGNADVTPDVTQQALPKALPEKRREEEKIDKADELRSSVASDGQAAAPACPHEAIVAAYHEILPELPRVRVWDSGRQQFLRSRWRESPERQTLDWWREFFKFVRRCPFLLGQQAVGDRDPFLADLEWLIRPQNFRKVIEGKYERRAA